jgi:hypothetical protein
VCARKKKKPIVLTLDDTVLRCAVDSLVLRARKASFSH